MEYCTCTEDDWECDAGFVRKTEDGPCVRADGKQIDYTPPVVCDNEYEVSQGYRRIAGDTCYGGVDHSPLRLQCPGFKVLAKTNKTLLIALLVIIFVLVSVIVNARWIASVKEAVGGLLAGSTSRSAKSDRDYIKYGSLGKAPESAEEDHFSQVVFDDEESQAEKIDEEKVAAKELKAKAAKKSGGSGQSDLLN
eukprot:TRINITY_DN1421_c0_g1_i1.p1 TRINITY_DN1421_c0_g1~~TRINITY_DN1421_c0_g1_i1.p1  ORF type:complete len:194 (-),score=57.03 TRINITY_DN1421_c0_g1_i1:106-687(-)